ncbi:MAG: biotin/lipoyl-binding protein [Bacteroidales bacterium]|nr:biotin/lipoyl-binding protein [Bacteroidales bacterium]MCF8326809.1 biotin/lipoyl-binding protein [Bacteroidales bacterium]
MARIRKLLVANRGEIAVRIMKTAKRLGIHTVAVYAENDYNTLHVHYADEAFPLGEGKLSDTYLNLDKLENIIGQSEVDAVHPGYGFLSENENFARICEENEVLFVGPSAYAIRMMGDKIKSREIAENAGINISKGVTGSIDEVLSQKQELTYPLLVKASAGGGGKGMRIVEEADDLESALEITAREAKNYFGNEHVYIEHYFRDPRHIEVQILGDKHGNLIHLYERECSLQRRHQKVMEEAPSPSVNETLRKKLTDSALKLAKEIGYYNAGTVEFLVDSEQNIYFLEMNTRIQVEHPVTEKITGIDIVELQINIAEGRTIGLKQSEIQTNGHAIQARLYAENPEMNYQPMAGNLDTIEFPQSNHMRIDTALEQQAYISPDYDPMLAKIIAHGSNRESAIDKLSGYLKNLTIIGKPTNQQFLRFILKQQDFIDNKISTQYLEKHTSEIIDYMNEEKSRVNKEKLVAFFVMHELLPHSQPDNVWQQIGFWRIRKRMFVKLEDKEYRVLINGNYETIDLQVENTSLSVKYSTHNNKLFTVYINNVQEKLKIVKQNNTGAVIQDKGFYFSVNRFDVLNANANEVTRKVNATTQGNIISPVYGRVVSIKVKEGKQVKVGDTLIVVESMKIENNIRAEADIQIGKIHVEEGEQIKDGQELIQVTNSDPA